MDNEQEAKLALNASIEKDSGIVSHSDSASVDELRRALARPLPDLEPGELITGRYKISHLVGRGASGTVYAAEQILMRKRFALKLLHAASDSARRRFQKEAQAASKLDHPNLVRATDFGVLDSGCLFMVMEFVEGQTLHEHLKRVGRLSIEEALNIFIPICFALEYAHEQGVIHRDLKPSNIILETFDNGATFVPKVVDFGIAKITEEEGQALTRTGEVFGTPLYMSPEQCMGLKVDQRSDIYSLGCVMYEALTGAPPFCAKTALETMMQHRIQPPVPMSEASLGSKFPDALQSVVATMLAKEPADRFQRCFTIADHLIRIQKGDGGASLPVERSGKTNAAKMKIWKPPHWSLYLTIALLLGMIVYLLLRTPPQMTGGFGKVAAVQGYKSQTNIAGDDQSLDNLGGIPRFATGDETHGRTFRFGTEKKDQAYTYDSKVVLSSGAPHIVRQHPLKAAGVIQVPPGCLVEFESDVLTTMFRPYLFRSFRPNDLDALRITFDDVVTDEDVDAGCFNDGMSYVSSLKGLHQLWFYNTPLNASGLANLKLNEMHDLECLSLQHTNVTVQDLISLPILRNLHTLGYSEQKDIPSLLTALNKTWGKSDARERQRHSLILCSDNLTNDDLTLVAKLDLDALDIKDNSELTDAGLEHLFNMKPMNTLWLNGSKFTPSLIQQLAEKLSVHELKLGEVPWSDQQERQLKNSLALKNCQVSFETTSAAALEFFNP